MTEELQLRRAIPGHECSLKESFHANTGKPMKISASEFAFFTLRLFFQIMLFQ
jgi:hypothetical protein